MATQIKKQPRIIGSLYNLPNPRQFGDPSETLWGLEAASQTYGVGDLVYLVSGRVTICGQSGNILNTQVAGIAQQKATGTTAAPAFFTALASHHEVSINVYHTTLGSAVSAEAQLGGCYGIKLISGIWVLDVENAVEGAADCNGHFTVTGFLDTIGDTYGRVKGHFNAYSLASDGNPNKRLLQLLP